jgi:hypothetical protein
VKHFSDGGISKNDNQLPLKSIEENREVNKYDSQMNEMKSTGIILMKEFTWQTT